MFVAELHDIAKLLDRGAVNRELKEHNVGEIRRGQALNGVQFDVTKLPEPSTRTWQAIVRHEGDKSWENLNNLPLDASPEEVEFRRQRFIVTLADRFASSIAREPRPDQNESPVVKTLWGTETADKTIKDFAGFRDLLLFLDSDPAAETFLKHYEETLRSIPEDRRAPVTTLYNHLRLVGKITRALAQTVTLEPRDSLWTANFQGKAVQTVDEAHGSTKKNIVGKWRFALVKVWAAFPHYLVRLQDLNLLSERREALRCLAEHYPDNVLYFSEDFALLFFHEFKPEVLAGLGDFQWRFRVIESDLTTMSSDLDAPEKFKASVSLLHGTQIHEGRQAAEVPEAITSELCNVCQRRAGTERWMKGILEDLLCSTCFKRRDAASPAEEYARWDDAGFDVAWIKLAVWPDIVRDTVIKLFSEAVTYDSDTMAEFRPLPLEMDFLDAYSDICSVWRKVLSERVPPEQLIEPVSNYSELVILRLDESQLWLRVIDAFQELLEKYMPKLTQGSGHRSPIQLSIDISSTKFPFHEHWRYFSQPGEAINIRNSTKSIELFLSVATFRQVFELTKSVDYRRPLHDLAELWQISNSRAAVLLSAWERRIAFEQKLRGSGCNVVDLVQFARLLVY